MSALGGRPNEDIWPSPAELLGYVRKYPLIVLGAGLLGIVATIAWLGRQEPVWTAQTTLLLRQEKTPIDRAAAPLHAMVQNADVASEMAFLGSRAPAAETVRNPLALHDVWGDPQLGLATQVEDPTLRPLHALTRKVTGGGTSGGRLRAVLTGDTAGTPRELLAHFEAPDRVRLSLPTGGLTLESDREKTFTVSSDEPVEYAGLDVWLRPEGDVTGKTFRIVRHEEHEAIRSLMSRTSIEEVDRDTRVLRVTVRDSDPHRAANSANGLVANYLAVRKAQAREKTEQRLGQVESELRRVDEDLREAFSELIHLRRETPLSIDTEASAKSLTLSLTSRGVDYTSAQLELTLVEEGIEALERGDIAALSRLRDETTDALTRILIEHIADLFAQTQSGLKAGSAAHVQLLRGRLLQLQETRDVLQLQYDTMSRALERLDEEGAAALSMLNAGGAADPNTDASTAILIDTTVRLATRRTELLSEDYLETHPDVVAVDAAIEENLAELRLMLANRERLLGEQLAQVGEFVAAAQSDVDARPSADRSDLDRAMESAREQVLRNLENLRDSLRTQITARAAELSALESQLAALPASERQQLGPLQVVDNAKARVSELLETRDTVKMMEAFFEAPAEIVDPATAPARRDTPRTGFSLMLGLMLGLGAGLLGAIVYDRRRGRVADENELEDELGLPVLGTLSDLGLARDVPRRDLRVHIERDPGGVAGAAFRNVRENLFTLLNARNDIVTIGITSAAKGEGKSLTSLGLALACKRAGRRVLLIDAAGENSRPGKRSRPGLVQVLRGRTSVDELITPSGDDGLDLLPAGGSAASVADAAASPQAGERLDAIASSYDIVLVDLPAMEGASEALAVARLLSALVVVHRSGGPTRDTMHTTLRRLDQSGIPMLGAVFNRSGSSGAKLTVLPGRLKKIPSRWRRAA